MNWEQVLVVAGAILLAGLWVSNRLRSLESSLARGSESLGELAKWHHPFTVEFSTVMSEILKRLEDIGKSTKGIDESLEALQSVLSDLDTMAQHFRVVRDRIKHWEQTEEAHKAWEAEKQNQHEAWEQAARTEADKLGEKGKKP